MIILFLSVSRGHVVQVAGLGGYTVNATGHTRKTIFVRLFYARILIVHFVSVLYLCFFYTNEKQSVFFHPIVDILYARFPD